MKYWRNWWHLSSINHGLHITFKSQTRPRLVKNEMIPLASKAQVPLGALARFTYLTWSPSTFLPISNKGNNQLSSIVTYLRHKFKIIKDYFCCHRLTASIRSSICAKWANVWSCHRGVTVSFLAPFTEENKETFYLEFSLRKDGHLQKLQEVIQLF